MVVCFSPLGRGWCLQTAASGRSHWNDVEKVCTSVNLSKACRRHEELGGYRGPVPREGWEALGERGDGVDLEQMGELRVQKTQLGVSCSPSRAAVLGCVPVLSPTAETGDVSCPTLPKHPLGMGLAWLTPRWAVMPSRTTLF